MGRMMFDNWEGGMKSLLVASGAVLEVGMMMEMVGLLEYTDETVGVSPKEPS